MVGIGYTDANEMLHGGGPVGGAETAGGCKAITLDEIKE